VWLAAKLSPFLISFAITSTFFINLCSWIFQCGCRALWAGADAACNIHAQHGRHCPWCGHGRAGYFIVMTLLCAPQLAVSLWPRWSWTVRTVVAIGLFPTVGVLVAAVMGWMDHYWT